MLSIAAVDCYSSTAPIPNGGQEGVATIEVPGSSANSTTYNITQQQLPSGAVVWPVTEADPALAQLVAPAGENEESEWPDVIEIPKF